MNYHAMQNPSASIHSHDVITLSDEAEGWWLINCLCGRPDSAQLGDRKCMYDLKLLAQHVF